MKNKDLIVCLVGESGSGKSTIAEEMSKLGYNYIQSYTTRQPRFEGERGHIFTDKVPTNDNGALSKNDMIAPKYFDNNHYWILESQFRGKGISIFPVEPSGVNDLKLRIGEESILVIYLKADIEIRKMRMKKRIQDNNKVYFQVNYNNENIKIMERVLTDKEIFNVINCNYIVDANRTIQEIVKDINKIFDSWNNALKRAGLLD